MRETKKALNAAHLQIKRRVKSNSPRARDHSGQVPPGWRWQRWNATGYRVRTTCSFMARHRVGMPRLLLYLADAMCRVLVGGPHAIHKEAGVLNVSGKGRESLFASAAVDTTSHLVAVVHLTASIIGHARRFVVEGSEDVLIVVLSKQL
ncbi:hypothetical protein GGI42DRAFT_303482 [Trichoderma sp. SZMC 28013]